jgi:hypothetical protein
MKRIVALALAFSIVPSAVAQSETTAGSSKGHCWGVAIELRDGPAALLAVRAEGDKEAIDKLVEEAEAMGLHGDSEQTDDGKWKVFIPFPSPPMTGAKARDLVDRAHAGAFGTLEVRPEIMDIRVLPRAKCPNAYL